MIGVTVGYYLKCVPRRTEYGYFDFTDVLIDGNIPDIVKHVEEIHNVYPFEKDCTFLRIVPYSSYIDEKCDGEEKLPEMPVDDQAIEEMFKQMGIFDILHQFFLVVRIKKGIVLSCRAN